MVASLGGESGSAGLALWPSPKVHPSISSPVFQLRGDTVWASVRQGSFCLGSSATSPGLPAQFFANREREPQDRGTLIQRQPRMRLQKERPILSAPVSPCPQEPGEWSRHCALTKLKGHKTKDRAGARMQK
mmetsp:Transcript_814/g.1310  ORF Transcript_814/g.1310 Transcript_814/m.1310 type:complete len:131 (-) Transcript_814:138-530(-)